MKTSALNAQKIFTKLNYPRIGLNVQFVQDGCMSFVLCMDFCVIIVDENLRGKL